MGTWNVRALLLLLAVGGLSMMATTRFIAGEGSNGVEPTLGTRTETGEVGGDPASARDARAGMVAAEEVGSNTNADVQENATSDTREFVLSEKGQVAVHGVVIVPDGWHFGAWQRQVIIRNIPVEDVSYGGGIAEVRVEPPDYATSGGVVPDEMSNAGSIIVGGNEVSRSKWTAPLEGDDSGELTRAIVLDDEGRTLAQVVTYIQAPTLMEERKVIEATFRKILASLETRPVPDSTEWERRELLSATWRFRARVPDGWTISAMGEEVFQVSGLGASGDAVRLVVEQIDMSDPSAASAMGGAYDIGALLVGRRALRVPGPQRTYMLVRGDGESLWRLHIEAVSTDDFLALLRLAQTASIDPVDTAPAAYPGP